MLLRRLVGNCSRLSSPPRAVKSKEDARLARRREEDPWYLGMLILLTSADDVMDKREHGVSLPEEVSEDAIDGGGEDGGEVTFPVTCILVAKRLANAFPDVNRESALDTIECADKKIPDDSLSPGEDCCNK